MFLRDRRSLHFLAVSIAGFGTDLPEILSRYTGCRGRQPLQVLAVNIADIILNGANSVKHEEPSPVFKATQNQVRNRPIFTPRL